MRVEAGQYNMYLQLYMLTANTDVHFYQSAVTSQCVPQSLILTVLFPSWLAQSGINLLLCISERKACNASMCFPLCLWFEAGLRSVDHTLKAPNQEQEGRMNKIIHCGSLAASLLLFSFPCLPHDCVWYLDITRGRRYWGQKQSTQAPPKAWKIEKSCQEH